MKLAVLARPDRPQAMSAASAAARRMRDDGHEVVEVSLDRPGLAEEVSGASVACVFGGDGTMLRAARALAPLDLALLGVNLGRLGFLTTTSVDALDGTLAEIAAGRWSREPRTLLDARLLRAGGEVAAVRALNDVVVARGEQVRSIHVGLRIDGEPFTVYWADGVIVATATGSTAYGFSVGGPIVLPASEAIVLVPIAPHLSFRNAVVLDPDQRLELEVRDEPSVLSVDGQEEHPLRTGDRIEVRRSDLVAAFVRTPSMPPFLELLRAKILKEEGAPG